MERDADVKRLAVGPFVFAASVEDLARDLEGRGAIDFLGAAPAPVGEDGVADEFIDRAAAFRHEVARFAKPDAELLGEIGAGDFLRHRAEAADVADEQCHRPDGGARLPAIEPAMVTSRWALEKSSSICSKTISFFAISIRAPGARVIGMTTRWPLTQGAVAAAEIDDLILVAVVTADEGVLARDERAAAQADGVVAVRPMVAVLPIVSSNGSPASGVTRSLAGMAAGRNIWQQVACDKIVLNPIRARREFGRYSPLFPDGRENRRSIITKC